MNNTFDFRRFLLMLKWDFMANRTMAVRIVTGLSFMLLGIFVSATFKLYDTLPDADDVNRCMLAMGNVVVVIFFTMLTLGQSVVFSNMKTKQARISFLSLPASHLEKFLARYLWCTVGLTLVFVVALVVADILRFLLCMAFAPQMEGMVIGAIFTRCLPIAYVDIILFIVTREGGAAFAALATTWLWLCSFYTLGGTFFRVRAWFPATCTLLVMLFVGSFLDISPFLYMTDKADDNALWWWALLASNLFWIALNYVLAFWLFRRMQAINDKWINL